MAEKVGGIEYEVGMDVQGTLTGTAKLNKTLDGLEKRTKQADRSVEKFNKTTKDSAKAIGGFGRKMGMAGVQFEQLIGSINGGQNVMRAVGFQATDLGYVLGFPLAGAIAGISASMVSVLMPALFNSKDAIKELEEISKDLDLALRKAGDGSDVLSERILKLAERSKSLARIEIAKGIQNSEKMITTALTGIGDTLEDVRKYGLKDFTSDFGELSTKSQMSITDLANSTKSYTALLGDMAEAGDIQQFSTLQSQVKSLSEQFKISKEQAVQLGLAISDMQTEKSAAAARRLENVLSDLNDATGGTNTKIVDLAASLLPLFEATTDGVDKVNLLRQAFIEINKAIKVSKDDSTGLTNAANDLNSALGAQIAALLTGEEAAFRYATAQRLGLTAVEELSEETKQYITTLFALKKAQDEAAKKQKTDEAAAQREQQVIDKLEQQIAQRKMSKTEYEEFLLMQQLGIENEGQMTEKVRERLELLRSLNSEQGTFAEGFTEQMEKLKESAENVEHSLGKAFGSNVTSAVDNLSSGIADAVMNQESLSDAVKETARAFVRDMIASLVKVAAQKAIGYAIEAAGLATITAASSTAAATAATAWAPAAALSSLASFGANAIPAAAGLASTVALSQGLALSGARYNGGAVAGGSMYRVGENNKPELLQSGNDQYLIPGNNGKITSNREMNNGSSATQITINNYGEPMEAKVSQSGNFVTIDMLPQAVTGIMQNDFANRGRARKTLENTSNLTNRTS